MQALLDQHGPALAAILAVVAWFLFRLLLNREQKRMDERFTAVVKLVEDAKARADSVANDAKEIEDEMGTYKDRIFTSLEGLRQGQQDLIRQNEVAHTTISGSVMLMDQRLGVLEKKMPNGDIAKLNQIVSDLMGLMGAQRRRDTSKG